MAHDSLPAGSCEMAPSIDSKDSGDGKNSNDETSLLLSENFMSSAENVRLRLKFTTFFVRLRHIHVLRQQYHMCRDCNPTPTRTTQMDVNLCPRRYFLLLEMNFASVSHFMG